MQAVFIDQNNWKPVSFKSTGSSGDVRSSVVQTNDGTSYVVSPALRNSKVSVTNDSIVILTDKIKHNDIFIHQTKESSPFTGCISPVVSDVGYVLKNTGGVLVAESVDLTVIENEYDLLPYVFTIELQGSGAYVIKNNELFLTISGDVLVFEEKKNNEAEFRTNQNFNIVISGDSFIVSTNETVVRAIQTNGTAVSLNADVGVGSGINPGFVLTLANNRDKPTLRIRDNLVAYSGGTGGVDVSIANEDIQTAKILIAPVITDVDGAATFVALESKETLTPSYTDSVESCRNYEALISCNNKTSVNAPLQLGYSSSVINLSFKPDQFTYFHIPTDAASIPLSASNLAESGALAADEPYNADKIFKKNAEYGDYMPWNNTDLPLDNGQYLCSWLMRSGSKKVWMDRWYVPSNVTVSTALSATSPVPGGLSPGYTDVKSRLTLDPGGLYAYYRVGNKHIREVVSELETEKKLMVDSNNWGDATTSDPLQSPASTNANGQMEYTFEPGTHVSLPTEDGFYAAPGVCWVASISARDWNNLTGTAVLGNYHHEMGMGLWVNNIETISFIAHDDDTIYKYNNEGDLINSRNIGKIKYVGFGEDHTMFVFAGNNGLTYTRYDLNDAAVMSYTIPNDITLNTNVSSAEMNSQGDMIVTVVGDYAPVRLTINRAGELTEVNTTQAVPSIIDCKDNIIPLPGSDRRFIKKNGECVYTVGSSVYRILNGNAQKILEIGGGMLEDVAMDEDENLWILHDRLYVSKMATNGELYFKKHIYTDTIKTAATSRNLVVLSETIDNEKVHRVVIAVTDGSVSQLHWLNYDGGLLYTKNYDAVIKNIANSFTYQKTHILDYYNAPGFLFKLALVDQTQAGVYKPYTYHIDTTGLTPGYHQFVIGYDWVSTRIYAYIDDNPVLTDNIEFPTTGDISKRLGVRELPNQGIIFGTLGFKQTSLPHYLKTYRKHNFAGRMKNIKFFHESITLWDAINILRAENKVPNLDWSVNTGNRIYTEEVGRIYLHRRGGYKSSKVNLTVDMGSNVYNANAVKQAITTAASDLLPAHSTINKITIK